ncbi:2-dehydropantoate 2-reductase [Actinospica durhamensis]|uniref:2-dehydropantoate 2-reductase n=1 Tax=Actinospica durhamensis TaxID=1508375 RepID=A0A941ETY9_9ACTN|nr:2-dehydropantoate 2-reductase [Actinospica durhamensis]MBR7837256.1 2-dehydropantoate 2-reductase [Actinospica durhamensis]
MQEADIATAAAAVATPAATPAVVPAVAVDPGAVSAAVVPAGTPAPAPDTAAPAAAVTSAVVAAAPIGGPAAAAVAAVRAAASSPAIVAAAPAAVAPTGADAGAISAAAVPTAVTLAAPRTSVEAINNQEPRNPLRIAVLGPGGVGGLLAAPLSHSGHDVVCIAGESTADILREKGIRVSSTRFGELAVAVRAETRLREPVDLCLITVKHTTLPDALDRIDPAALRDALIVPFLNGCEHPAFLRNRYGAHLVAPATIRVESTRLAPGVIEHSSAFADIELASDTASQSRLAETALVFADAGFAVRVRDDETSMLWAKLSLITPLSLMTTRYGMTVGQLRSEHSDELYAVAEEVVSVARANGAQVDLVDVVRLHRAFPETTKSSMQRDAEAGRSIELDAIGGAVLRAAALRDVPVPTLTRIVANLAVRGDKSGESA